MNQGMGQDLGQQTQNPNAGSAMFLDSSNPSQEQGFDLSKATHDAAIYYQQNRKKTSLEKVAKQFGTTVKRVRNRVKKLNENPTFNPNSFIVSAPSNPPPPPKPLQGTTNGLGKVRKQTKKQQLQERQQELQREVQRQQSIVQQQVAAAQAAQNALGVVESMHQLTLDPSMIQLNGLGQSQPQQILQFQQLQVLSQLLQQQHQHRQHHQLQQQLQIPQYLQQQQQQQLLPHHGSIIDFNNLENVKLLVNNDKLTIEEIKYVINYLINKILGQ